MLQSEIVVRLAAQLDLPSIDSLLVEWLSLPRQRDLVFKDSVRNGELWVAELNGAFAGFLHQVVHNDVIDGGPNSFITALYVSPKYRRSGVGSALLRKAIQDTLKKGVVGIEASTTNPEARKLYEKYGFKQFKGEISLEMDMDRAREV